MARISMCSLWAGLWNEHRTCQRGTVPGQDCEVHLLESELLCQKCCISCRTAQGVATNCIFPKDAHCAMSSLENSLPKQPQVLQQSGLSRVHTCTGPASHEPPAPPTASTFATAAAAAATASAAAARAAVAAASHAASAATDTTTATAATIIPAVARIQCHWGLRQTVFRDRAYSAKIRWGIGTVSSGRLAIVHEYYER